MNDRGAVHTIRLRPPWQQQGRSWQRAFNCPTNLDADERVELVIDFSDDQIAGIELNDQPLAYKRTSEQLRCDITATLMQRNELRVMMRSDASPEHQTRLEISRRDGP